MFKKILVAEDYSSYNYAVKNWIEELKISQVDQAFYCDDALLKIKKSFLDNEPYELLITDLSFSHDREFITLTTGEELIKEVNEEFPELKIIVFTIENRPFVISTFMEKYKIDAFVTKGRKDIEELKKAIEEVYKGKTNIYTPCKTKKGLLEFTHNDMEFIKLLATGMNVAQVSEKFKKEKIRPNSISYLNKRLMFIRQQAEAKNTLHLFMLFSDWGLI
jgi:two-component system, NarL family, captular synthesis response regulator RcsB